MDFALNSFWRRLATGFTLAALTAALVACGGNDDDNASESRVASLKLVGAASIPTGTLFEGVELGGISGLDQASDGSYWAISDDRGGERGTPRFYNLSIDYAATGPVTVKVNRQTFMQREDGTSFPASARTVDPEAIRLAPNGNLYWSSEGNWGTTVTTLFQPFVREMTTSGKFVREFKLPTIYNYADTTTTGARSNKLFEALTVAPDGTVFVANEDALIQDGPLTTVQAGSVVRVTALDPATGSANAQYAYQLPKIPVDAPAGAPFGPDNGLSDFLAIGNKKFIAVERAFASGIGNTIRLVLTEITDSTTNVSNMASLAGAATHTPMTRKLLLEMPINYQGVKLDNIEAITWGKTLPNGHRTIVLAADNNFTANTQANQFIVFEVIPD
ncbi:esterase-like activity of phytase family protein [Acidovorax sp. D2M1]|uniref:Esterase-like activity of phytase family protein n=1 Tax=Acidovorax benzenivorans TaxID=2987520 RepID=A0ABT5S4X2_9BURK|nr:esterase-like activity of phytase family protein [Acidovorax benzenivorans]MDD2180471.1 esterase-like activity of phytase family protein [Acidovorax benzenivorans]